MKPLPFPKQNLSTPFPPPSQKSSCLNTISSRASQTSNKYHIHQSSTLCNHTSKWQFLQGRRESRLNSLFNRRKTMLESISRKNKDIYARILKQESHYGQGQKIRPLQESLTNASNQLLEITKQALIKQSLNFNNRKMTIMQQSSKQNGGNLIDFRNRMHTINTPNSIATPQNSNTPFILQKFQTPQSIQAISTPIIQSPQTITNTYTPSTVLQPITQFRAAKSYEIRSASAQNKARIITQNKVSRMTTQSTKRKKFTDMFINC